MYNKIYCRGSKGGIEVKLFIIGNGFDKGHGLKTSYWDFRNYLYNLYPDFLYAFESHYYIYPANDDEAIKEMLWNELEKNLANIDEDVIVEDALQMEMGLESGDNGIEETLYEYFTEEYKYIERLAKYLKQWVRTIRVRDVKPKTSLINSSDDALYITFNYTAVLERVYGIKEGKIIHIHGSLRGHEYEPVLGHGNIERIENIEERLDEAERMYDEKEISICKVVKDYYERTYKDVNRYMYRLSRLRDKEIDEIYVIGHSVSGVDLPYFRNIGYYTENRAKWIVYYFNDEEKERICNSLISCGIKKRKIDMRPAKEFYNL
jgi:hypothetical protein